jgi:hypothetical protein
VKNGSLRTGSSRMPRRHKIFALIAALLVASSVFAFLVSHPSIGQDFSISRIISPSVWNDLRLPESSTAEIDVSKGSSLDSSPKSQDPDQAKEEALLRVTIAVLDVKTAELDSRLRKMQTPSSSGDPEQVNSNKTIREQQINLEAQVKRLQDQKLVVEHRLDEMAKDERRPKTLTSPSASAERYTDAHVARDTRVQTAALSISLGFLCGLLYVAVALWRFRPVRNVEALKRVLDMNQLLVGTIGEITR